MRPSTRFPSSSLPSPSLSSLPFPAHARQPHFHVRVSVRGVSLTRWSSVFDVCPFLPSLSVLARDPALEQDPSRMAFGRPEEGQGYIWRPGTVRSKLDHGKSAMSGYAFGIKSAEEESVVVMQDRKEEKQVKNGMYARFLAVDQTETNASTKTEKDAEKDTKLKVADAKNEIEKNVEDPKKKTTSINLVTEEMLESPAKVSSFVPSPPKSNILTADKKISVTQGTFATSPIAVTKAEKSIKQPRNSTPSISNVIISTSAVKDSSKVPQKFHDLPRDKMAASNSISKRNVVVSDNAGKKSGKATIKKNKLVKNHLVDRAQPAPQQSIDCIPNDIASKAAPLDRSLFEAAVGALRDSRAPLLRDTLRVSSSRSPDSKSI